MMLSAHGAARPSTTHAAAMRPVTVRADQWGSRARAAWSERGIARKLIPKALTKHAAASPLVSASTPTATGAPIATSGLGIWTPETTALKIIHADAKPLS